MDMEITIGGVGEVDRVAKWLLGLLGDRRGRRGSNVVAFYGVMGAGKTTLIREICSELGVAGGVSSPTFAIVNQYVTRDGAIVNHFDFYRVEDLREVSDMGFEEYLVSGDLCLVEWPENVEVFLPEDTLRVRITTYDDDPDRRTFSVIQSTR